MDEQFSIIFLYIYRNPSPPSKKLITCTQKQKIKNLYHSIGPQQKNMLRPQRIYPKEMSPLPLKQQHLNLSFSPIIRLSAPSKIAELRQRRQLP
jgi:hypothetical protein